MLDNARRLHHGYFLSDPVDSWTNGPYYALGDAAHPWVRVLARRKDRHGRGCLDFCDVMARGR